MVEVNNKLKEDEPAYYLSRESDPRVLAQILETLKDYGALPFNQLSSALRERGFSFNVDKARTVRKELEFLGWLLRNTERWELSNSGEELAGIEPVKNIRLFSISLAIAHERTSSHLITHILDQMWAINPKERGVVIIPQPLLENLQVSIEKVRQPLRDAVQRWNEALKSRLSGFNPLDSSVTVEKIIHDSLTRWDKLSQSQKRSNILKAFADRFLESMFGELMTPADVRIWQNRLDWAGITHTAQQLPGVEAHVWFPVGDYFKNNDIRPYYEPIPELARGEEIFCCYSPSGEDFQKLFGEFLYEGYLNKQQQEGLEYVSLLSVRDWVCYRLRIGHWIFETTLQELFPRALKGELPFTLALEVDITPRERRDLGRGRPVVIDGTPRFIIAMRKIT